MIKFNKNDKSHICEFIIDEHRRRSGNRKYFDKQVAEIDRQLRMEPDISVKKATNGTIDETKSWLPEAELPLQSQTLEVTESDVMRMLLPNNGPWFRAHAAVTDDYYERADFQSLVYGDSNDIPNLMNQDGADNIVYGILNHWHKQYSFRANLGLVIGESIKYSMGLGRARYANKRIMLHTDKGVVKKEMDIPVFVPRSIKNTWLDDSPVQLMNEGYIVAPGNIFQKHMKLKDLQLAASKGNPDVDDIINGGWDKSALNGLEADDHGNVEVLEWEGDMVVPRKTTENIYIPNSIITVVVGQCAKKTEQRMIRIRKNKYPFSSYIEFPFHRENIESPYGSSPLMKGRPVHASAVYALNRLLEAGAYDTQPAIQYDSDDEEPDIFPGAKNQATSDIKAIQIGNPVALSGIYANFLQQYADVTGVNAPRLGAQTVSHTTAYAKDAELQRGQIRTVDFVNDTMDGPLTRWLDIEYFLTKKFMKGKVAFAIPQFNYGYVDISKDLLPDDACFEVFGAGGPQEEQVKKQMKLAALNQAVQIDSLRMQQMAQLGQAPVPKINLEAAIEQILSEGGWSDLDQITKPTSQSNSQPAQEVAGINPGLQSTVLQTLAFGGPR